MSDFINVSSHLRVCPSCKGTTMVTPIFHWCSYCRTDLSKAGMAHNRKVIAEIKKNNKDNPKDKNSNTRIKRVLNAK